ncbi:MAG: N-acetylmuramoyl-L-alanine amidase [Chloroflexota bacterium]
MPSRNLVRSLAVAALFLGNLCATPNVFAATTVAGQTIVIDPGHGGKDPGAIDNGIQEKTVTLAVGQQLATILQAEGANVILTRSSDVNPAPNGTVDDDLQARVSAAQQAHANAFLSIHANETADPNFSGATTFYGPACGFYSGTKLSPDDVGRSYSLAQKVQGAVVSRTHEHDAGVQNAAFWVLGNPGIPAILVETGFLSNKPEAGKLVDPSYQHLIADAIADGVNTFFASGDAAGTPPPAPSGALAGCSGTAAKDDRSQAQPVERWVQTIVAAPLLSGADANAKQFTVLAPFTYLKILDQKGDFFYVLNPAANSPGWVEAKKVGPSGPPPPAFQPFWVESFRPTQLWSGADGKAADFGPLPLWSYLRVLADPSGPRFYVQIADTGKVAYVNQADVGPSGAPPSSSSAQAASSKPAASAADKSAGAASASQPKAKAAAPPASSSVTVAAGDTLSGIAAQLGLTVADLIAANHLGPDGLITVGQQLALPGTIRSGTAAPKPSSGASTGVTIGSGDTLSAIAAKYGTSVQSLVSLNHLASADDIQAGQTLSIA